MDINNAIKLKLEVEKEIAEKIDDFQLQTNMTVKSVYLHQHTTKTLDGKDAGNMIEGFEMIVSL